jgi:hypothetical protein
MPVKGKGESERSTFADGLVGTVPLRQGMRQPDMPTVRRDQLHVLHPSDTTKVASEAAFGSSPVFENIELIVSWRRSPSTLPWLFWTEKKKPRWSTAA